MREDQGDAITRAVARVEATANDMAAHSDAEPFFVIRNDNAAKFAADIHVLLAALREARADAARLGWLERTKTDAVHRGGYPGEEWLVRSGPSSFNKYYAANLRDAIDAARAAGGTNG